MPDSPNFETQVLVDLSDIKGSIKLVVHQIDSQAEKSKEHDGEIKTLQEQVARNKGRDAMISLILPILVSTIVAFIVAFIRT